MRNYTIVTLVIIAALCCACSNRNREARIEYMADEEVEQPKPLPEGAITFDYSNHLYFEVVLRDSVPAKMIFDTGNTNILIDNKLFKEYFAPSPTLQRVVIQGTGNSLEAAYRDTSDWKYNIGEYSHTEQGATVMDLQKILGNEADGMFGMEFMRGRKVEFNYADEYMRILPSEEQPDEGYTCVKCKWLDNREARMVMPISLRINNAASFDGNFLVDIGSSGSISLNSSLVAKLKLNRVLTDVKKKIYDTGGVGGSRTDYIFTAKGIAVAGYEIEDVVTDFSGNTQGMMANDNFDGLVGNAFFERFDVIFDFAKCEIWLRPNRNFGVTKRYDSGMTLTPQEDCWIVNGLVEGGNAHRAGIRRGDIITSINGLTREQVSLKELKRMNRSDEDWKVVVKRNDTTNGVTFKKEKY
ncbi:MAG: aspartyl protease family protein [Alistipes sp.]|nr:aspartyl protease family protein [Alistipes sp.]